MTARQCLSIVSHSRTTYVYSTGLGYLAYAWRRHVPIRCARALSWQVQDTRGQVLLEYRVAPEKPCLTLSMECYTGLKWLHEHADQFVEDKNRIATAGENLTAVSALMVKSRPVAGPAELIYLMLDDRMTVPQPELEPLILWNTGDNITGWTKPLGKDVVGLDKVEAYAAPTRAHCPESLPPLILIWAS
ncbi:hypothetical protein BDV39DRAFT_204318 [Aspergillus sergii]|uniref:Alpha/beta hydrolase fold-3 domain-containing protein n=1 Tax=Aspergillus sergii TaxID=1034303 RepID=A0A5N6X5U4_9EURO|nr:hypothetical protein BDV39DRAFT_204318 [Aspergillus sergii]